MACLDPKMTTLSLSCPLKMESKFETAILCLIIDRDAS